MMPTIQIHPDQAKRLVGLHPRVYLLAVELLKAAMARGLVVVVTQGLRTIEQQDELYAQGRTKPGKIVTNARGGTSYHNYGLAFDIAIVGPDNKIGWDTKADVNKNTAPDYDEIGKLGKSLGLEWGGDFKTMKDLPHFQLTFGLSIKDLLAGKRP